MILFPTPFLARSNIMRGQLNFLVAASAGQTPDLAYSNNARHWFKQAWPAPDGYIRSLEITFAEGMFWVWCHHPGTGASGAMVTDNGRTWTYVSITTSGNERYYGISRLGNGVWVAFGSNTLSNAGCIRTSSNLTSWVSVTPPVSTNFFMDSASSGSRIIGVGGNGMVAATANGVDFTAASTTWSASAPAFAYWMGGNFVYGGSGSYVAVSSNGTSFALMATGISGGVFDMTYAAETYLAAGNSGSNIRLSSDLTTWDSPQIIPDEYDSGAFGCGANGDEIIIASRHPETVFIASSDGGQNFAVIPHNLPFPQARIFCARS